MTARADRLDRLEQLLSEKRPWAILVTAAVVGEVIELTPFGPVGDEQVLLDFWGRTEVKPARGVIDRLVGKLRDARNAVQDRALVRVAPRADHTGRLIIQALDEMNNDAHNNAENGAIEISFST